MGNLNQALVSRVLVVLHLETPGDLDLAAVFTTSVHFVVDIEKLEPGDSQSLRIVVDEAVDHVDHIADEDLLALLQHSFVVHAKLILADHLIDLAFRTAQRWCRRRVWRRSELVS